MVPCVNVYLSCASPETNLEELPSTYFTHSIGICDWGNFPLHLWIVFRGETLGLGNQWNNRSYCCGIRGMHPSRYSHNTTKNSCHWFCSNILQFKFIMTIWLSSMLDFQSFTCTLSFIALHFKNIMICKFRHMCCSCLLAVLQGVINSAVNFSIQTWCCQKSGPILVTVFAPLQTIFATVLALAFLGDSYYLGR